MAVEITNLSLTDYPFGFVTADVELPFDYRSLMNDVEDAVASASRSENENFQKIEIREASGLVGHLLEFMCSPAVVDICARAFDLDGLHPDPGFDGGGLTVTEEGGFLRYHNDFPYSNSAARYRVVNALLYLSSPDIEGGELHLLDPHSKTVEARIKPTFGTFLAFPTSKDTPHGFSRIRRGRRVSVNSYLYRDKPLDDRFQPSRTEWL